MSSSRNTTSPIRCNLTITFGEFLHAIFWEIGLFGTPDQRDEALRELGAHLIAPAGRAVIAFGQGGRA